jgi:4-oxalocrotonate tautomerase family enzyme
MKGVIKMPLVKVEILKGKSQEYKKALLDGIHQALVDTLHVPEDDRIQRLYELEKDNFEIPPYKTDNFILIEMSIFKGRSYEAKKNLYKAVVDNLEKALRIKRTDVLIVIHEPPLENWGTAGGKPASEINLGFTVEV